MQNKQTKKKANNFFFLKKSHTELHKTPEQDQN